MKLIEKLRNMSAEELAEWHLMAHECDACRYANENGSCVAFENEDGRTNYECCLEATVALLLSEVD